MPQLPREASKRNNWEKERRERFNRSFEELGKILPTYDPTINISRIEILKEATNTISELREEIITISKSTKDNKAYKDELIKKLQERIKKLLVRNEQLVTFLKDVGIKLPRNNCTAKQFRRHFRWCNKILPQKQQNILEKNEKEKENVSTIGKTRPKLITSNQGVKRLSNKPAKQHKPKKNARKLATTNNFVFFPRLPAVPTFNTLNQHFVLVQNPNVVNMRPALVSAPPKTLNLGKEITSGTNTGISTLKPVTLLTANCNIISVVSQPQIAVPSVPVQSQPVVNQNKLLTTTKVAIGQNKINFRKNEPIRPKTCVTRTTQIIKVPIPALTSKYSNTSLLLKNQTDNYKQNVQKSENAAQSGTKRKSDPNQNKVSKKRKKCNRKKLTPKKCDINSENTEPVNPPITSASDVTQSSIVIENKLVANVETLATNPTFANTEQNKTVGNVESENKCSDQIESDPSICNISVTKGNDILDKHQTSVSCTITSSVAPESAVTTVSSSLPNHNVKNIDLNLVHSDLSNDIFASLQVPPGCQNMESTSPTAAFLLAFPLVSSMKVTEVIDEDNCDSQRVTPTLLQIGNMDNTKPTHSDNLSDLDNFSFFNTKDVCDNYYNSKPGVTHESNTETVSTAPIDSLKSKGTEYVYEETNEKVRDDSSSLARTSNTEVSTESKSRAVQSEDKLKQSGNPEINETELKPKESKTLLSQIEQNDTSRGSMNNLPDKNNLPNKISDTGMYTDTIQGKFNNNCNIMTNNLEPYSLSNENACKQSSANNCDVTSTYKSYKDLGDQSLNNFVIGSLQNDDNLNTFPSKKVTHEPHDVLRYSSEVTVENDKTLNPVGEDRMNIYYNAKQQAPMKPNCASLSSNSEETRQNTQKCDATKISEPYNYNPKQFMQDEHISLPNFSINPSQLSQDPTRNLVKPEETSESIQKSVAAKIDTYIYNATPFLQNQQLNSTQLSQDRSENLELSKRTSQNIQKSDSTKVDTFNNNATTYGFNCPQLPADQGGNLKKPEETNQHIHKYDENKKDTFNYNPKQFLHDQMNLTNYSVNSSQLLQAQSQNLEKPEGTTQNIQKSAATKVETFNYTPKQFLQNNQTNYSLNSPQVSQDQGRNLKNPEGTIQNVQKSVATEAEKFKYTPKPFLQNNQTNYSLNSSQVSQDQGRNVKNPEGTIQNMQNSVATEAEKFKYTPKPFLQNNQTNYSLNSSQVSQDQGRNSKNPEGTIQNIQKSVATEIDMFNYTPKQFLHNNQANYSLHSSQVSQDQGQNVKNPEGTVQNIQKSATTKVDAFNYTPKQFSENNQTNYSLNSSQVPKDQGRNLKKPERASQNIQKAVETFNYTPEQFLENNQTNYSRNSSQVTQDQGQNLKKPEGTSPNIQKLVVAEVETFNYNSKQFLPNSSQLSGDQTVNFEKPKETSQGVQKDVTKKQSPDYRPKQFLQNQQMNLISYSLNPTNMPTDQSQNLKNEGALQNIQNSDSTKVQTCHYNPKQFLQNQHMNLHSYSVNSAHISQDQSQNLKKEEGIRHNIQRSDASKVQSFDFNAKLFLHNEQMNLSTYSPNSSQISEEQTQNLKEDEGTIQKSENTTKLPFNYNPKQFLQNKPTNLTSYSLSSSEDNQNMKKHEETFPNIQNPDATTVGTFNYNPKQFLQSEQMNLTNYPVNSSLVSGDQSHGLKKDQNLQQKSEVNNVQTCNYNSKHFLQHQQMSMTSYGLNSSSEDQKKDKGARQNVQKSDGTQGHTLNYKSKQFMQNQEMTSYSVSSSQIPEKRDDNFKKDEGAHQSIQKTDGTKVQSFNYNPKQFLQNQQMNLPTYSLNSSRIPEDQNLNLKKLKGASQNLQKSDVSKIDTFNSYNPKQFMQIEHNNLNSFSLNSSQLSEVSEQNLGKPEATGHNSEATKMKEISNYNSKPFLPNEQIHFPINSSQLPEQRPQQLEKPLDSIKMGDTYQYNSKQLLQNAQCSVGNFHANSSRVSDLAGHNTEKSETTKPFNQNPKHFTQTDHNLNTFSKVSKHVLDKPSDTSKTYHYNPFEVVQPSKEANLRISDTCNKLVPPTNKEQDIKSVDGNKTMGAKQVEEKSCVFSSNYMSTSCRPDPKISTTCSFDNTKNYSNPFYTNCNYMHNYSDTTNVNQNYYKTDPKSCYSLNYDNYQEYRNTEVSLGRDRRNSTNKEKVIQNKPVNWMTNEQKSQTTNCFLPSFTNQSYSFTSCISSETNDNHNYGDLKKTADFTDKRFSWSPSKLPNFLEPSNNFITPTLPTLVGDLALGNALPLNEAKIDYKCPKDIKRKTYENQANFLSVSQLVNQNKTDTASNRTSSRKPTGSKSKTTPVAKQKRFEKSDKTPKAVNNFNDLFYDQKDRSSTKNISSNYSAEALIGNHCLSDEKKFAQNPNKLCPTNFLAENMVNYFTTVEENYINPNQNFHTYTSFQSNNYSTNGFIYTTPTISSSYLGNNYDNTPAYSTDSCEVKDKNCGGKTYRSIHKDCKNIGCASNGKKTKKAGQSNNTGLGNFDYSLLPIQGSTNSPILPDDFQSHNTFLPPTTPYTCKNPVYQKQVHDFNSTAPLLPLTGIARANIQHPEVSPSLNPVGTSLTNFNLSTIFPEINKGTIPNVHSNSNKSKTSSGYVDVPFNAESKYGFSG